MRDIERLLIAVNIAGSVFAGARHEPLWFVVSFSGFAVYVVLQDRALRRRIGARAWPSEGFARFTFNTNLYFSARHLLFGTILFALAGNAASLVAA